MKLGELLLGRPLRSEDEERERIGPLRGIPVLGLDALASAAYGPEAALTVLLPLGAAAVLYILPIGAAIIVLLVILYLSYRQTIAAYPGGGGAYTVASENLGRLPGLIAASALLVDYILNVAVAISAGVGAAASAVPALLPHTMGLTLAILALLTLVNLRGVREAGLVFMVPTYAFLGCLGLTIILGTAKSILAHGHPTPVVPPPPPAPAVEVATAWLLLRAFASGCTAMTGVEAVSNAVPIFREPTVTLARRTLTAIVAALALLLAGIAYLCLAYHVVATPPGRSGYQSVLSSLTGAVAGRGGFYYVTIATILTITCFSANTSFADFPRVCRLLALDEYLPSAFAHPGRRLVYTTGILNLALCAGILLIVFGGITDRLIPLFAIGAFLAFTMSQAGMVAHWKRVGGPHAVHARILNGLGATATGATLVVVAISKFSQGAWITVLVIPSLLLLFLGVRRYNERLESELGADVPLEPGDEPPPLLVVPIKRLDRLAHKALRLAMSMSPDVEAVQVFAEDSDVEDLRGRWRDLVERPARAEGVEPPRLILLRSPYREFFGPLLAYVCERSRKNPDRYIGVVVPELVERRWYHALLHTHRATVLKELLLLRGGPRLIVIDAPWYVRGTIGPSGGYPTAQAGVSGAPDGMLKE
ncbi:MAG TPA: APC family permease [Gemmatimonadaceae bacterium]|nr:APC family permease [Gemmatimonadaceae bacterium]